MVFFGLSPWPICSKPSAMHSAECRKCGSDHKMHSIDPPLHNTVLFHAQDSITLHGFEDAWARLQIRSNACAISVHGGSWQHETPMPLEPRLAPSLAPRFWGRFVSVIVIGNPN